VEDLSSGGGKLLTSVRIRRGARIGKSLFWGGERRAPVYCGRLKGKRGDARAKRTKGGGPQFAGAWRGLLCSVDAIRL